VEAYARLARDLDLAKLESTVTEVGLADAPKVAQAVLRGEVRGRTLVDVRR
jgi:acrylyl-CoA reductase (NADPH)